MSGQARQPRIAIACAAICCTLITTAFVWTSTNTARAGGGGDTIHVYPGPNAIHMALARAQNGDTLLIHPGRYHEHFGIYKRVRLVGLGEPRPLINGDCQARFTIRVRHSGVVLSDLRVVGADKGFGPGPAEVDFRFVAKGRAERLGLNDRCDAEYGVNIFDSGRVTVFDSQARGFGDAGFYVGGITDTGSGALRVRGVEAYDDNRGIIVEDSAGGDVRITASHPYNNGVTPGEGSPTGIFLRNSDGVLIGANTVTGNASFGIHLDPDSDNNVINGTSASGNGVEDFRNEGSANCGTGNSFGSGDPLSPCP
jgi:parallel beta-helix repeat protein